MRKTKPVTLSIPQACHESWQDMTPNEKGRFCQHCQKTVIDFSIMSDNEIANLVNHSKEQICGRLHISQLNREIYATEKNTPWMKIAAVVSALTLTAPAVSAKNTEVEIIQADGQDDNVSTAHDSVPVIKGQIIDSTGELQLPGVTILVKGTRTGVISDTQGNFRLRVPEEIKETDITLTISSIGFVTKNIRISLNAIPEELHVKLERHAFLEDESIIIAGYTQVYQPTTAWQRFKNKIRRIFH